MENIILKLLQAAEGDVSRAQTGIIYIDAVSYTHLDVYKRQAEGALQVHSSLLNVVLHD